MKPLRILQGERVIWKRKPKTALSFKDVQLVSAHLSRYLPGTKEAMIRVKDPTGGERLRKVQVSELLKFRPVWKGRVVL